MTITISRLYNSYAEARTRVRDLEAAGVKHGDISILASNADNGTYDEKAGDLSGPRPRRQGRPRRRPAAPAPASAQPPAAPPARSPVSA